MTPGSAGTSRPDHVSRFFAWFRSNRLLAPIIVLFSIIVALASFFQVLTGQAVWTAINKGLRDKSEARMTSYPAAQAEWGDAISKARPMVAYVRGTSLYVYTPGARQHPRLLDAVSRPNLDTQDFQIVWSPGGRYLTFYDPEHANSRIWYYDAATEEQGSWSCGCLGSGFVGKSLLALTRDMKKVSVIGLSALPLTVSVKWSTPTWAVVLGGSEDGLIVEVPAGASAYGGPVEIWLIAPSGGAVRLFDVNTNTILRSASLRPGTSEIATLTALHSSACAVSDFTQIVDVANASSRVISSPGDKPFGQLNQYWAESSLAWGGDGKLYSVQYHHDDHGAQISKPTLYCLVGNRWQSVKVSLPIMAAYIGPLSYRALLHEPNKAQVPEPAPDLYIGRGSRYTRVADGVTTAAWSPF
jgi:hypothetical protein